MLMLAWGLAALTFSATAAAASSERYIENSDRFPGWKGELPAEPGQKGSQGFANSDNTIGFGELGQEEWRGEVIELSWTPRAFLYKGFLSDEECQHFIDKAKPGMTKSTVVDNETGKSVDSTVRTSTGTFFNRGEDDVVRRIEKRIAQVSHIPVENGEGIQILHYVDGQKYEPHHDYFHDKVNALPENGGQRIATVLMYLTTVDEGGETVFPNSPSKVTGAEWSECAKKGLAVKTRRGDALLFYGLKPDGDTDPSSLHGSCPTTKGEKWSATKWMHVGAFGRDADAQKAGWGACVDADSRCNVWASKGECQKNPNYMLHSCRKACKTCTESPADTAAS